MGDKVFSDSPVQRLYNGSHQMSCFILFTEIIYQDPDCVLHPVPIQYRMYNI